MTAGLTETELGIHVGTLRTRQSGLQKILPLASRA